MAKNKPKAEMSDDHKAALAAGRSESNAVRAYLDALEAHKPRRGRRRTPESLQAQLARIDEKIETATSLDGLLLLQQRRDLEAELESLSSDSDLSTLEEGFVAVAASYAERKGVQYATWREAGVSAAVLSRAGVSRYS